MADNRVDAITIQKNITRLRDSKKYSEEELSLATEDMKAGLSLEQVHQYLDRHLSINQMKAISECIRQGYDNAFIDVIAGSISEEETVKAVYQYYENGMPLAVIEEQVKAKAHNNLLIRLSQIKETKEEKMVTGDEEQKGKEEVKASEAAEVKEVKNGANPPDSVFDPSEMAERITDAVVKAIGKDNSSERMTQMEKDLSELRQMVKDSITKSDGNSKSELLHITEIPKSYQCSVQGINTHIETTKKKPGFARDLFSAFCFRKKSRRDIVKLVTSGELNVDQLAKIKFAIKAGLTESQLVNLINSKLPAEQLEEIIQIAVLENQL